LAAAASVMGCRRRIPMATPAAARHGYANLPSPLSRAMAPCRWTPNLEVLRRASTSRGRCRPPPRRRVPRPSCCRPPLARGTTDLEVHAPCGTSSALLDREAGAVAGVLLAREDAISREPGRDWGCYLRPPCLHLDLVCVAAKHHDRSPTGNHPGALAGCQARFHGVWPWLL
jgi:hypothetical protein